MCPSREGNFQNMLKRSWQMEAATSCVCALQAAGWTDCPTWRTVLDGQRPAAPGEGSPGEWPHAPKRERLSGMGSQLRRHSTASWHVTPSSFAVAVSCPCHAAHRTLTGMGKALVGCFGSCGPASDMQRRPRSLDNASAARRRKRRAAGRGPPPVRS